MTKYDGFTEDERAAMKEHAQELKKAARRSPARAREDGERDVLAKIAEMGESDRVIASRIHELVKENAPGLTPRLWYGSPAYAKDGKVLCFFQPSTKFKTRYATFGFSDVANLDDGSVWATSFALTNLTEPAESTLATLLHQAAH